MGQAELVNDDRTIAPIDFPLLDGLRVLVVDDDPDTRMLFAFALQQKGAIVSTEASAQAALATMQATHFDLLISDIGLPNIDGYSFLRQVRALPVEPRAQIPAMAITGFADEQTRLQILAAGFQRALVKPTDIDQFVSIVADLVGRSQCVTQHYSQK